MRTSLSSRGALVLPLVVVTIFGAFACTGSPTQPDLIADTATGARPRSFDASSPFAPTELAPEEFEETEFAEQELTDESELTEDAGDIEEVDATDLGASDLDASDFAPRSLTASTPTAAATARTFALTGVIKDKTTRRVISGVMVKITGLQPVRSNSRGVYRIDVRTGRRTLKFSKQGYATTSVTRNVAGGMRIDVFMTATGTALSSVSLSDNDVTVGTVVNGTVTLNKAAPSGGAKISLSSTSPATAAIVSSIVTIPAGKKTGAFKVNAKAAGTTVIKATYNNASKTANLKVGGGQTPTTQPTQPTQPTNTTPVAKFDYSPSQCPVIAAASGVLVTCTFNASDSTALAGSTYEWTFPGGNVFPRPSATFTNVPLPCGTLPNGIFERTVTLTVTSNGVVSVPFSRSVTFTKTGLC